MANETPDLQGGGWGHSTVEGLGSPRTDFLGRVDPAEVERAYRARSARSRQDEIARVYEEVRASDSARVVVQDVPGDQEVIRYVTLDVPWLEAHTMPLVIPGSEGWEAFQAEIMGSSTEGNICVRVWLRETVPPMIVMNT